MKHMQKIIDAIWTEETEENDPTNAERVERLSLVYAPLSFSEGEAAILDDLAGAALGYVCSRRDCHCHDMADAIEDFLSGYIWLKVCQHSKQESAEKELCPTGS